MTPYGSNFTRKMWSSMDHILLIYVGSAAEFALVEENHWLFYTGKLPGAPWDRFVSTFAWNKRLVLGSQEEMAKLAGTIRGFHRSVEHQRSEEEGGERRISNEAYRAVGDMLIDYALRAEAYLEGRELSAEECEVHYQDQREFFTLMGIEGYEPDYPAFQERRLREMPEQLRHNDYSQPLFEAYRKDLGAFRYWLLLQFMSWFVPEHVREQNGLKRSRLFAPVVALYPRIRCRWVSAFTQTLLLPKRVREGLA